MTYLDGVAVVELHPTVAVAMAGRYFADLGARVAVIPPPGSGGWREFPPHHPETGESLLRAYLEHGKSIVDGSQASPELLTRADLVLHPYLPADLGGVASWTASEGQCAISIRPFGEAGPRAGEEASDLAVTAASGVLWLTGFPERPPALHYGYQASCFAALAAVTAGLSALMDARRPGSLSVSQQEALAAVLEDALPILRHLGIPRKRVGNELPKTGPLTEIYATSDGAIATCVFIEPQWDDLLVAIDRVEWRDDPRFATWALRAKNGALIRARLAEWCLEHTAAEVFELLQGLRIPTAILQSPADLLADEQAAFRGLFQEVSLPSGRAVKVPGLPFVSSVPASASSTVQTPRPADAVAAELARGSRLRPRHELARVRVLDLTQAWAGPFGTLQLGNLGCDVIKVESSLKTSPNRIANPWELDAGTLYYEAVLWFHAYNGNKRSLNMEVTDPRGYELFMQLVTAADIVVDNFSPRVMPQLGLDYPRLSAVNPRIIQVRMNGYGAEGPLSNTYAYGESLEAGAGITYLTRSQGRPLRCGIAYPDVVGGYHGAIAMLAGLIYRDRTGHGLLIDVSERDATIRMCGEAIAEAAASGTNWLQEESEHPVHAPSGVYPCRGEDRWLAIRCRDDREWAALAAIIGTSEPGRETAAGRRASRRSVDALVAAWTAARSREEARDTLRAAGIEAEPVSDLQDLTEDAHLLATGFERTVAYPGGGQLIFPGSPVRRDGERLPLVHPPLFGEHTEAVLAELLGLAPDEIAELAAAGAILRSPAAGSG